MALGQTPGDIGGMTLVTLIVFSASAASSPGKALTSGLLAAAGGLLQMLLSLALWRVHRYRPESRALATLYEELARSAETLVRASQAPAATEAVVAARTALAPLDASRSVEAGRYLALFSQAERMRLALLALGRLHVRIGREAGAAHDSAAARSARANWRRACCAPSAARWQRA